MPKHPNTALIALGLALAAVQVLDVVVHAATAQLEPLRVTANGIILLWLVAEAAGRWNNNYRLLAGVVVAVYLGLNLIFLAEAGITNPAQGGAVRVALLAFVLSTGALAGALIYRRGRAPAPPA